MCMHYVCLCRNLKKNKAAAEEKNSWKEDENLLVCCTMCTYVHIAHTDHTDRNVCHFINEVKLPQCEGDDRETIT